MNELQIFTNSEFGEIRTITEDGKTLFCGKDVAAALGYAKPQNAVTAHCRCALKRGIPHPQAPDKTIEMLFIPEGDIYRLAAKSELPGADAFERWIFDEVLPSIHRDGAYLTPDMAEQLKELVAEVRSLTRRMEALETGRPSLPMLAAPSPLEADDPQVPGKAFRKRWMRTASEKLDLISNRLNITNNSVLHQIYQYLEKAFDIALDEERLRTMEEYGLDECSVLTAVFYDPEFRNYFQRIVDHNLAPENRGW